MAGRPRNASHTSFKRSPCPVTNTLDVLGDKWTLLVVRDLFLGKCTFKDFRASPEGIPTNLLAERLKRLEHSGIIDKVPYQQNPLRYEYRLTQKGEALGPVLQSMIEWGNRYIPGTYTPEQIEQIKKERKEAGR